MLETLFGPPGEWPRQDLIGFSDEMQPSITLTGYRCGVFPMPLDVEGYRESMGWWSPMRRARLEMGRMRITRSLRKTSRRYTTTVDAAFPDVLAACSDPRRPDGWIDDRVKTVYTALHLGGYVHSVETWDEEGRLVGGLYAVHQNALVAGESMFHDPVLGRDASKVALMRLLVEMRRIGAHLLDVQWLTPHLMSLGAVETSRQDYLRDLDLALSIPHNNAWSRGESIAGGDLVELLGEDHHAGDARG